MGDRPKRRGALAQDIVQSVPKGVGKLTGVGFKATKEFAQNLPLIRNNVTLINAPYEPLPKSERLDRTKLVDLGNGYVKIYVGDSKEGWVEALRAYFNVLTREEYEHVHTIKINYNSVRPKGERLKTFGGTASGPEPLMEMFEGIDKVIKGKIDPLIAPPEVMLVKGSNVYVQLRPIHILDIGNLVGTNVVVGGVRRTAEIFLFDADDFECMFAKYGINGIWDEAMHKEVIKQLKELGQAELADKLAQLPLHDVNARPLHHRRMSNNSIAFEKKPERKLLHLVFTMMQAEGEPGLINLEEARRRRPNAEGINPCAEILLDSYGVCNLTTVNLVQFVKNGKLQLKELIETQKRSVRAGLRMTLATLELPHWDKVQQRDRLLGASLTGVKDAMSLLGYDKGQERSLLETLRKISRLEALRYAKELRVNAPLLVTTVKPEGTISQVAGGVSSGLHYSHAPYYIRRIRINSSDPLAKVVQELGWRVYAEVGTEGVIDPNELAKPELIAKARTLVIDFPVASGATKTKDDVNVREQFDNYFMFQRWYTDHNSSNTIHVRPDEWKEVADIVYENWDDFVGVSFLAYDGGTYTLAPYEAITKEQYEEMVAKMKPFDPAILEKYEKGDDFDLEGMDGCEGGACPIR